MGEFNFSNMFDVAPATASIWFWSFMIINCFILLNLLLAIIFDHYMAIKDAVGESKGLEVQFIEFLHEFLFTFDWFVQRRAFIRMNILEDKDKTLFGKARGKSLEDGWNCSDGGRMEKENCCWKIYC